MRYLLNKEYKVDSQWKVGAYRIDLVVIDGNKMIAVECDGERWHGPDHLSNDLQRQAILERLGWKFIRIRGSEFYKNPELTMEWVCNELEENGIKPNFSGGGGDNPEEDNNPSELLNRIKVRAEAIRKSWKSMGKKETEIIGNEEKVHNKNITDDTGENSDVPLVDKGKINYEDMVISNTKEKSNPNVFESEMVEEDNNKIPKPLFDFRN